MTRISNTWCVFLALYAFWVGDFVMGEPWELRLLNDSERARCLDGSSSGYYFHRGTDTKSFVFHLQGVS